MNKTKLRKKFISLRKNKNIFNIEIKKEILKIISNKIIFKNKIIAGYFPVNHEISIMNLLEDLEKKNNKIVFPRIKNNNLMEFYRWKKIDFLTINNFQPTTNDQSCRLRFFESGVEETASVYQRAQYISDNGSADFRSTGDDKIVAIWNVSSGTDHSGVAYLYLYNLNDSSKYSFLTQQEVHMQTTSSKMRQSFGGGVLPQTSTVDQIKLFVDSGNFSCTAKLYGVKQI